MTDELYSGPIIDAHIHLWDLAGDHYPWLMPGGSFGPKGLFDSLKKNYVLEDYRRDIAGQNVIASVHIEALWSIEEGQANETRWLETLDKSDNLAIRYTAGVPFRRPDTDALLREQASFENVVAIRQTIAWNADPDRTMMPDPNISRLPEWRAAIDTIVELGLKLELLLYPWQADEVLELATAYPDLTVIVDHVASPMYQSEEGLAAWRRYVLTMAKAPNVLMKISSVIGYIPDPTQEKVSAIIGHVVEAFGADRLMIGSDFPPGSLAGFSYAEVFGMYREALKHLPADEQYAIFCGTAAREFRIPVEEILASRA